MGRTPLAARILRAGDGFDARGFLPVHAAAAEGDVMLVVSLLERGAPALAPTEAGQSLLDIALGLPDAALAEYLVLAHPELLARPPSLAALLKRGDGALVETAVSALARLDPDAMHALVEAVDEEGKTPLHHLLAGAPCLAGFSLFGDCLAHWSTTGFLPLHELGACKLADDEDTRALVRAVVARYSETMGLALADVLGLGTRAEDHLGGMNVLMLAASTDNIVVLRECSLLLLERPGAYVDLLRLLVLETSHNGNSALHWACGTGSVRCLGFLLGLIPASTCFDDAVTLLDARDRTALFIAAGDKSHALDILLAHIQWKLKGGTSPARSPLYRYTGQTAADHGRWGTEEGKAALAEIEREWARLKTERYKTLRFLPVRDMGDYLRFKTRDPRFPHPRKRVYTAGEYARLRGAGRAKKALALHTSPLRDLLVNRKAYVLGLFLCTVAAPLATVVETRDKFGLASARVGRRYLASVFLLLVVYLRAARKGPGAVLKRAAIVEPGEHVTISAAVLGELRAPYCYACNREKKQRTKHCGSHDSCVPGFDHCCPWLGCDVSVRNHRAFFALLVVCVLVNGFWTLFYMRGAFLCVHEGLAAHGVVAAHLLVLRRPLLALSIAVHGFLTVWPVLLLVASVSNIRLGLLSYELNYMNKIPYLQDGDAFVNPWDRGSRGNLRSFFSGRWERDMLGPPVGPRGETHFTRRMARMERGTRLFLEGLGK